MLGRVESDPSVTGLTPRDEQEGSEWQFSSQKPRFLKAGPAEQPNLSLCDLGKTPDLAPSACPTPQLS